ncbi:jupiter microtubule associated homolog 1-like [Pomacea canaliculata]|uniref:jupiter microtubule associated homolog 1-like n=1 Tax=Pomacea canaliculata TaxID=400727 RepID=UPI000D72C85E|nr:jupiter microtubule associated homolog 1-like [Pomacea canaliculata]
MTTTSTFSGLNEDAKPTSRVLKPPGGGSSNIFGAEASASAAKPKAGTKKPTDSGVFGKTDTGHGSDRDNSAGRNRTARDGSYNPITGADYKDLVPTHHALNVKEPPKPQKEQPPLPYSDGEFQVKEGKAQNVHTSSRVTNPPGGKTHKLW